MIPKQCLAIFITLLLVPQIALASQASRLKQVMDEYHYSLTVEWNQDDPDFLKVQKEKFQEAIEDLIKQGLSIEDLKLAFNTRSEQRFDELIKEMQSKNINDRDEIIQFIQDQLAANYSRGASWEDDGIGPAVGALAVMGLLGFMLYNLITEDHSDVTYTSPR